MNFQVAALFHIGTTKSHPPIPDHLSAAAKDFLLKCLQKYVTFNFLLLCLYHKFLVLVCFIVSIMFFEVYDGRLIMQNIIEFFFWVGGAGGKKGIGGERFLSTFLYCQLFLKKEEFNIQVVSCVTCVCVCV